MSYIGFSPCSIRRRLSGEKEMSLKSFICCTIWHCLWSGSSRWDSQDLRLLLNLVKLIDYVSRVRNLPSQTFARTITSTQQTPAKSSAPSFEIIVQPPSTLWLLTRFSLRKHSFLTLYRRVPPKIEFAPWPATWQSSERKKLFWWFYEALMWRSGSLHVRLITLRNIK